MEDELGHLDDTILGLALLPDMTWASGRAIEGQACQLVRILLRMSPPPLVYGEPEDWFWEGHVQRAIVKQLKRDGWRITFMANAAARQQGEDILAVRNGRTLVVEVKGYPSKGYRDPRRASEVKSTSQTSQAAHWYAQALLGVARRLGTSPSNEVAIGLPDFPRYRSLISDTTSVLRKLRIGVYLVSERKQVTAFLPHERRSRSAPTADLAQG